MWLIVGLGNPGEEYAQTRHNIGFQCLQSYARRHQLAFDGKRAHARIAEGTFAGPVSYTHLDVYKRQAYRETKEIPF